MKLPNKVPSRIDKVLSIFHNRPGGDSARKWWAFFGVLLCIWVSLQYTTTEILPEVLTIWLVFVSVCLGSVTAEQIIRFKNGAKVEEETKHEETSSKETTTSKKTTTPVVDEDISQ